MLLKLTEEQAELRDMIREFGENEMLPVVGQYDRSGIFPTELYRKLFAMGLHALDIPEELGGSGVDAVTSSVIFEELAKYDAGIAAAVGAVGLAFKPLAVAGNRALMKRFAEIVVPGNFAAFCLTEPGAGSDAGAVRTAAVKDGEEYVINGSKCFITNGGLAEVYTVIASTDPTKGIRGLSAFLVERDREGISIGKEEDKMGIRLSQTCDVVFQDVRIPADHLIGKEGDGFKISMLTLDLSRPTIGAAAVGICQRCLDICVKYAKERLTFGKPIAKLQSVQFMLADMEIATDMARQYARYTAARIDAGLPHSREAAIVKCFAGDAAVKVTTDAVQILGGYGYMRDYPVEKLMRDAKIFQIFEGTNQIQRVVIAGQLLG